MKCFAILTSILFPIFLTACDLDLSSQYGVLMVESPSGEKFYLRREARGLNYDSLHLSQNSDFCAESSSNDIRFTALGPIHPFYKFEDNKLHLYSVSSAEIPADFSAETEIILHELDNLEYMKLKETYKSKGLELVNIPLNNSLKCE